MDTTRSLLGTLHLAAGFIALAAFWFPLFLKKGSKAHRRFGWVFVGSMAVILTSAATMTVSRIAAGDREFALFMGFLTLITFVAVWGGIAVLRVKDDPMKMRTPFNFGLRVVILAAALGLLWQWSLNGFPLLLVFGIVGLLIAIPDLIRWRKPPASGPRYWWFVHLESMITAGMAAHIAFFAFGSTRIWPDLYAGQPWWLMLLPWVAPFPIAFIAITMIQRHYRRKFSLGHA